LLLRLHSINIIMAPCLVLYNEIVVVSVLVTFKSELGMKNVIDGHWSLANATYLPKIYISL
jgi:hypothetical protein